MFAQMHSGPRRATPRRTVPARRVGWFCVRGFEKRATWRGLPWGSTSLFLPTASAEIFSIRSNAIGEVEDNDARRRLLSALCQPFVNFAGISHAPSVASLLSRMDRVNNAIQIVRQQKTVGPNPQQTARASLHDRLPTLINQKSSDEVLWPAVPGSETNHTIACPDLWMPRSVQRHQKASFQHRIRYVEIFKPQRRAMRRKGVVSGRNLFAVELPRMRPRGRRRKDVVGWLRRGDKWIGVRLPTGEIARRPTVVVRLRLCNPSWVLVGIQLEEGLLRLRIAQVINSHIRREQGAAIHRRKVRQPHGVAQPTRSFPRMRSVRVHHLHRRTHRLLLLASIAR